MRETDPGSAREEAERLVVSALAAARLAVSGARLGGEFATGSAECCVCPVCRAVAALRDPDPGLAERLATGAGDLAAGVASLLRAVSSMAGSATPKPSASPAPPAATPSSPASGSAASRVPGSRAARPSGPGDETPPAARPPHGRSSQTDQVWRAATRAGHDSSPAEPDVWAAATRAGAHGSTAGTAGSVAPTGPGATGPAERTGAEHPQTPGDGN